MGSSTLPRSDYDGLDLGYGPRSHGGNGVAIQNGLGIVLPLWRLSYKKKNI